MRVPSDRSLADWIYELIRTNKLYQFYKSREWLALRDEIMSDHHYECDKCDKLGAWEKDSRGRWIRSTRNFLRRAETAHHEYEVRSHPSMALTRYVTDADGNRKEVIHPLCNLCHNEEHGRFIKGNAPKPPLTKERW